MKNLQQSLAILLALLIILFLSMVHVYAQSVQIKRLEGSGNMARALEFVSGTHDSLFVSSQNRIYHPVYDFDHGPIRVEIINPSLVPAFEMMVELSGIDSAAGWKLFPVGGNDTIYSDTPIGIGDEQLIPEWGMLVQVKQVDDYVGGCDYILSCSIEQSTDPWLTWLHDTDEIGHFSNWIRSGMVENSNNPANSDYSGDPEGCFEDVLDGTWAPYKLSSHADSMASPTWNKFKSLNDLDNLHSVDIVITADQSKWTRCAVLEIADAHVQAINDQQRFNLRLSPSVDKNGNPDGSGTMGMSWFPGYAVNLETGERLNMAFGENSWLQADNGADMIWNPTSTVETVTEEPIMGGGHYIYVFGHNGFETNDDVPLYDEGQFMFTKLSENNYQPGDPAKRRVFKDAMWVSIPLLEEGHQILESDVKIKLRVRKPYVDYQCLDDIVNQTHPLYSFNTINTGTGINDEVLNSTDLLMYPNPTSGTITLTSTQEGLQIEQIDIVNVLGEVVYHASNELTAESIDLALSTGFYLAIITTNKGMTTKRLIVQSPQP